MRTPNNDGILPPLGCRNYLLLDRFLHREQEMKLRCLFGHKYDNCICRANVKAVNGEYNGYKTAILMMFECSRCGKISSNTSWGNCQLNENLQSKPE